MFCRLLFATALSMTVAANAQEPLTTRQMEALSPRQTDRVVKNDLLSILRPVPGVRSGMYRMLHGVSIAGRPFGTQYGGLCQTDTLSLSYRAARSGTVDKDMPVLPYGMEVSHQFHLVRLPQGTDAEPDSARLGRQPSCEHLSPASEWFGAPDADTAFSGSLLLAKAVREVKAGAAPAPNCEPSRNCQERLLAAADPSKLDAIATCPTASGRVCYTFELGSSDEVTIEADGSADALGAIRSITIREFVIVT